ncbi:MAG: 2-amino-4-hydroxy-6-hydroxymethyldihydropteridine diphosphokinase [Bacteroidota bacterium]
MNVAYLCLGGNIGDRENALRLAVLKIGDTAGQITASSSIYETEAWGVENQQAYLNQCIELTTHLGSAELLTTLLFIEKELGRERSDSETYQPRTIDIDILFFNREIITSAQLIVPHPRLHLRKFVLVPLKDICPGFLHPLLNKTILNLWSHCPDTSEVTLFNPHL